jgi:hypothetical protein
MAYLILSSDDKSKNMLYQSSQKKLTVLLLGKNLFWELFKEQNRKVHLFYSLLCTRKLTILKINTINCTDTIASNCC